MVRAALSADGMARLNVQEWGDPAGPPVVCIHGVTGHSGRFRELGPGDSVHIDKDVVHGSYNDFDEPAQLQVVLAPAHGEGGYTAVDVSVEEPWASLR